MEGKLVKSKNVLLCHCCSIMGLGGRDLGHSLLSICRVKSRYVVM